MSYLSSLLLICLVAVSAGLVHNAASEGKDFVRRVIAANGFKHRLRVCNAYPEEESLDIMRGKKKLTTEPLDYKKCADIAAELTAGDKLKFMVGGASAGTFTVSDLPNNDAVLLLIIHRHDTLSTSVSFQSHVFANLLNAQVAVIDTYKGRTAGFAEITDGSKREEKLKYNSVVAVNTGKYEVTLTDSRKKVAQTTQLVALNRESYVIIRTGVESQEGAQYPQALIVYPMSDPKLLHSSSPRSSMPFGVLGVFALIASLCQ